MIRALIFTPLVLLLVLFALSNPQTVHLGIWPTDISVEIPLSIALMLSAAFAFVLGAVLLWFSVVGSRLRARRAEHAIRLLEAQVRDLKAKLEGPAVPDTSVKSGVVIDAKPGSTLTTVG